MAVRRNTNMMDPRKPPRIVNEGDEAFSSHEKNLE